MSTQDDLIKQYGKEIKVEKEKRRSGAKDSRGCKRRRDLYH